MEMACRKVRDRRACGPLPWAVMAALCLLAGCAHAAPAGPIVFPPRPRVAFSRAEMEAWRADPARAEERKRITAAADGLLKKELYVPDKEGDWIFYYACPKEGAYLQAKGLAEHVCPTCGAVYTDERTVASYRTVLSNRLEREMYDLALAWALTRDDRYATPVRKAFLRLAELYPTFGRHDRWGRKGIFAVVGGRRYAQHLDEAVSAILLAKAYDLVADSPVFSAADRERIEQDFLGATVREVQQYYRFVDPKGRNNHITWFNAACANVGLAIGDDKLLRDAVSGKRGLAFQLRESVTDDGIWYEGTMAYHFYALSAVQETLKAITAVGWDLSADPRLKGLYLGPIRMAYPDGSFPVINDSDPASLSGRAGFYQFALDYFKDPVFAPYADPSSTSAADRARPGSAAMAGIGIVALRRGEGANAVCAMIDYGIHGDHHGHPDKLNIVLYALGREIVLDPGRLTYSVPEYETWARTTVAHNTVVIDRRNQKPTEGSLLFFRDAADYSACLCASDGAYPDWILKRFLVLTDRWLADAYVVSGTRTASIDWLLHARGELAGPVHQGVKGPVSRPLPEGAMGAEAGYQHLRDVKEWDCETSAVLRYRQPDGRTLGVHCWEQAPLKLYTGIGIGYRLNDPVPFLLRRRQGKDASFVTVYDLSGTGDFVQALDAQPLSPDDTLRIRISAAEGIEELRLDLRAGPMAPGQERIIYTRSAPPAP